MKNHLGPDYKFHTLTFGGLNPFHIDTSLVLIGPGRVIVNPDKPCHQVFDNKLFHPFKFYVFHFNIISNAD